METSETASHVWFNAKGKQIAKLQGTLLIKEVYKKHMFFQTQGWGIDKKVIEEATDLGAKNIKVHVKDAHLDYCVSVEHFWDKAQFKTYDGPQYILPGSEWTIVDSRQGTLF